MIYSQTLEYRLQLAAADVANLLHEARTDKGHANSVDVTALLYVAERLAESQKVIVRQLQRMDLRREGA